MNHDKNIMRIYWLSTEYIMLSLNKIRPVVTEVLHGQKREQTDGRTDGRTNGLTR